MSGNILGSEGDSTENKTRFLFSRSWEFALLHVPGKIKRHVGNLECCLSPVMTPGQKKEGQSEVSLTDLSASKRENLLVFSRRESVIDKIRVICIKCQSYDCFCSIFQMDGVWLKYKRKFSFTFLLPSPWPQSSSCHIKPPDKISLFPTPWIWHFWSFVLYSWVSLQPPSPKFMFFLLAGFSFSDYTSLPQKTWAIVPQIKDWTMEISAQRFDLEGPVGDSTALWSLGLTAASMAETMNVALWNLRTPSQSRLKALSSLKGYGNRLPWKWDDKKSTRKLCDLKCQIFFFFNF